MHSKSNSSNSARAGDTVLPSPVDLLRGKTYHSEQEVEVEVEYDVMWTKVESLENVLRRERLSELERERERETERSMELAIIDSLNAKCKALEEEEARMEEDRNKFLQQLQAVSDWLPPLSPRGCVLQTEGERGRGREREEVGPASRVEVKQTEEELQWRALEKETEEALEDLRADFEREQQEQKNRQREKHKKSAWERLGEKVPWGVENPPLEEREWSEERELVKETDELRARFEREKERGRGWEREEKSAFRGRGRGRMLSLTRQLPPPNSEQVFSLLTPAYIRGSYS